MARHRDGVGERRPFGIEAADQDPDLAVRGYVMARSGTLPTDPSFLALSQNDELLAWTYRWYRKVEDDWFAALMEILGVVWTREHIERIVNGKENPTAPDRVMIPLAMAVNPELREGLQKIFRVTKGRFIGGGEYHGRRGEQIVELADLPREEFMQWAQAAIGAMNTTAPTTRDVTISDEDPRVAKARELIRASKRY